MLNTRATAMAEPRVIASVSSPLSRLPPFASATSSTVLLRPPVFALTHLQGGPARVTALFGGDRRDAARKALESALGEKKEAFSKWDEEIKKREAGGSGGKGRGRGWGGGSSGGGGSGGSDEGNESSSEGSENKWDEVIQVGYAFLGLTALYAVLTRGKDILAVVLNSILYVSRGFKPRPTSRQGSHPLEPPLSAESHVRSKWGSD